MTQDQIIRITQEKFQQALVTLGPKALEIDIKFGLNLEGELSCWDIKGGQLHPSTPRRQNNTYEISTTRVFWSNYVCAKTTYDALAFGGHLRIFQGKHGYSTAFHRLLRGIHSEVNLRQISDTLSIPQEGMVRLFKGKKIILQRFCPHQGYDLADVQIDESGIITCPAHAWKFDCLTGRCIRGDHQTNLQIHGHNQETTTV